MTDPTPTPAPVVVTTTPAPVVVPAPAPVTPPSSVVTTVETDAKAVEAKAMSFWASLAAHPALVVLVLGAAAVGVAHFVLGVL